MPKQENKQEMRTTRFTAFHHAAAIHLEQVKAFKAQEIDKVLPIRDMEAICYLIHSRLVTLTVDHNDQQRKWR